MYATGIRKGRRTKGRRGFTFAELAVCSAIAGMLFVFAAPALNKGRDGANRLRCENNLRQLAQAHLMYANDHGGFPPMALAFNSISYVQTQGGGPGGWYDGHGWYSLIGPYIGEPEWAAMLDLTVSMSHPRNAAARRAGLRLKIHACPADIGMTRNEWNSNNWARIRSNYVVNAGNTNYGQQAQSSVPFLGAPFAGGSITPLPAITDGLSNTLLMSEIVVFPESFMTWGGAYSEVQTCTGGQTFVGFNPPNTAAPDTIGYGRTGLLGEAVASAKYAQQGIPQPLQGAPSSTVSTAIAPRSKHAGGINASLCDGSAGFIADGIDPAVWRALSSRGAATSSRPRKQPRLLLKQKPNEDDSMLQRPLRSGFTFAEVTVCAAIAGMLFVFAAPALNKGRDGANRLSCENNLRQLAQAHLMYAAAHGGLPPMALSFSNVDYQTTQPGPGGWYDGHGWYSLIGPYIGEPEWASSINFRMFRSVHLDNQGMRRGGLRLKIYACPADIGLQRDEWTSNYWAHVLGNYVVNAGNTNYGQRPSSVVTGSLDFLGAPFAGGTISPLASVTDGLANTLMMSEVPVLTGCSAWGGAYSSIQNSLGGQIFTGLTTPNNHSPIGDGIGYGWAGNGDCGGFLKTITRYRAAGIDPPPSQSGGNPKDTYIAARSHHPGGVNASLCDGSAGFIADAIDPAVWRALSSASGNDFVPPTQAAPPLKAKAK